MTVRCHYCPCFLVDNGLLPLCFQSVLFSTADATSAQDFSPFSVEMRLILEKETSERKTQREKNG